MALGVLDAGVLFRFEGAELQLAVDRQRIEEHGLRAILVEKGGADLHPAPFLVSAGIRNDRLDFAMGLGHGGENW
jgi:hypothetical protein